MEEHRPKKLLDQALLFLYRKVLHQDLSFVEAGQLRIVIEHLFKVGGTNEYGDIPTDGSVGSTSLGVVIFAMVESAALDTQRKKGYNLVQASRATQSRMRGNSG